VAPRRRDLPEPERPRRPPPAAQRAVIRPRRHRGQQLLEILRHDRLATRLVRRPRDTRADDGTLGAELLPLRVRSRTARRAHVLHLRVVGSLRGTPCRVGRTARLVLDGLARIGLPVPVPPDGAFYDYYAM
jgi:hypothetical protein